MSGVRDGENDERSDDYANACPYCDVAAHYEWEECPNQMAGLPPYAERARLAALLREMADAEPSDLAPGDPDHLRRVADLLDGKGRDADRPTTSRFRDMDNAHLYAINMRNANLRFSVLTGSDIRGVDLRDTVWDEWTLWPQGIGNLNTTAGAPTQSVTYANLPRADLKSLQRRLIDTLADLLDGDR